MHWFHAIFLWGLQLIETPDTGSLPYRESARLFYTTVHKVALGLWPGRVLFFLAFIRDYHTSGAAPDWESRALCFRTFYKSVSTVRGPC